MGIYTRIYVDIKIYHSTQITFSDFGGYVLHPVILKAYSWFSTHESLLVTSRDYVAYGT